MRPAGWLHFLLFPAAGWFISCDRAGVTALGAGVLCCAFLLAHAYGFNNYMDGGRSQSVWYHRGAFLCALAAALFMTPFARACAALFVVVSAVYSGRPRLKGVAGLSVALNGVGFALLVFTAVSRPEPDVVWLSVVAFLWVAASQLVHEEAHAPQDEQSGLRTTAIALGPKRSRALAAALLAMAAGAAFGLGAAVGWALVCYAAVFAVLAARLSPERLRRVMRDLGLLWALAVGVALMADKGALHLF